jgi:hypothetical protein
MAPGTASMIATIAAIKTGDTNRDFIPLLQPHQGDSVSSRASQLPIERRLRKNALQLSFQFITEPDNSVAGCRSENRGGPNQPEVVVFGQRRRCEKLGAR